MVVVSPIFSTHTSLYTEEIQPSNSSVCTKLKKKKNATSEPSDLLRHRQTKNHHRTQPRDNLPVPRIVQQIHHVKKIKTREKKTSIIPFPQGRRISPPRHVTSLPGEGWKCASVFRSIHVIGLAKQPQPVGSPNNTLEGGKNGDRQTYQTLRYASSQFSPPPPITRPITQNKPSNTHVSEI